MPLIKHDPYKRIWNIDVRNHPDAVDKITKKYLCARQKPDMIVIDGFVVGSALIDELRELNIPAEPYRYVSI